jgi:hypothetical protein
MAMNKEKTKQPDVAGFLKRKAIRAFNQGIEARIRLRNFLVRNYEDFLNNI